MKEINCLQFVTVVVQPLSSPVRLLLPCQISLLHRRDPLAITALQFFKSDPHAANILYLLRGEALAIATKSKSNDGIKHL